MDNITVGSPTQQSMARSFAAALTNSGIPQAVFARQVGVSAKHLNQVLHGKATARVAALDYWAYTLGWEWVVELRKPGHNGITEQTDTQ